MKATEYSGELNEFRGHYEYQPELTARLDSIGDGGFTQRTIDEIVLWKLNRYVAASGELLSELNTLKALLPGEHRKGEEALRLLLQTRGADLAMASTILRFRNPEVFQIIDRHAFRAIYGTKFSVYTGTAANRKVAIYFDYLDQLIKLCNGKGLNFHQIDRLLYMFDKEINGKL